MMVKQSRLFRWQALIVLLMLFGYSGYYLCRSNFSVALPLIAGELVDDDYLRRFLDVILPGTAR